MQEHDHLLREAVEAMESASDEAGYIVLPALEQTEAGVIDVLDALRNGGNATLQELATVVQHIADMIEE